MSKCEHLNKEWISSIGEYGDDKIAHFWCEDCGKIIIDIDTEELEDNK